MAPVESVINLDLQGEKKPQDFGRLLMQWRL